MPDPLATLIRRGRDLDAQIKRDSEELKKIKAAVLAKGAGEHLGTDGAKALVIFPSPSIKPDETGIATVKRLVSPRVFGKLFVETVIVQPIKEFRAVLEALVEDKDKRADIIEACEKDGTPQVRFS